MIAPNPHPPHAPPVNPPLTFAAVCKMADRSLASRMGRGPRQTLVWRGAIYLRCSRCPGTDRWHTADHFHHGPDGRCLSQCKRCAAAGKAEGRKRARPTPRDRRRAAKAAAVLARAYATPPTPPIAPVPVAPMDADGGNPGRAGRTADDVERGRFEQALRLNPLLTWAAWVELTARERRGRKPRGGADERGTA